MRKFTVAEYRSFLATNQAHTLLDVRREAAYQANPQGIAGHVWQNPAHWLDWKDAVAADKPVVLYCAHGKEISQGLCAALSAMGREAYFIEGGFSAWAGH